jgi:hypothetical protein
LASLQFFSAINGRFYNRPLFSFSPLRKSPLISTFEPPLLDGHLKM